MTATTRHGRSPSPRAVAYRFMLATALLALVVGVLPQAAAAPPQVGGPPDDRGPAHEQGPPEHAADPAGTEIEVVSGRPDTVTGGTALVRVHLPQGPRGQPVDDARVWVDTGGDTHEVSDAFRLEDDGTSLLGLVEDLPEGEATLRARAAAPSGRGGGGFGSDVELAVTNYPAHGPVFSGPHQQPFRCDPEDRSGLLQGDRAYDEFCHIDEPVVEYYYLPEDVEHERSELEIDDFKPLDGPDEHPENVKMVETSEGDEAPFIVRNERGTLNRGVYNIAVLHDPDQQEWGDPLEPQEQWNERVFYRLQGACRPGHMQGRERAGDIIDGGQADALADGYGVARHTFTRHGNACGNDVLSAESMMMVREHFTTTHGEPKHMIGAGTSGGPIQMHLIADNYPGILDGIIAGNVFPDAFSIAPGAGDASLLANAFDGEERWADEGERTAVSGFGSWPINMTWVVGNTRNIDPGTYIGRDWDDDELYDEDDGYGIRATIYEAGRNSLGIDPDTGYAQRPLDNTGVQYGLQALKDEKIDEEQFVDINERVGGFDANANVVDERMRVDEDVIARAYETGRVLHASEGLADVPILAWGRYEDEAEFGADYHDRFRDFSVRGRLLREHGHFANHVMWHTHPEAGDPEQFHEIERLRVMDEWVTNLGEHDGELDEEAFLDTRPDGLTDECWTPDGERHRDTQWPHDDTDNPCIEDMPPAGDPRIGAGAPIENDTLKCTKTDLDFDAYPNHVKFDDGQKDRLEEVFADGVCDWSQPGVGQVEHGGTWQFYDEVPGAPERLDAEGGEATVTASGAEPGDVIVLRDAHASVVATGEADEEGGHVFTGVEPGDGYTVEVGSSTITTSDPVEVQPAD